jgi:hypothetical protein
VCFYIDLDLENLSFFLSEILMWQSLSTYCVIINKSYKLSFPKKFQNVFLSNFSIEIS